MWAATDPLGHAGLTVAVVFAASFLLPRGGRTIDYRLVIIGSLLPDLLDKSFGTLFLPDVFNPSGRLMGHTLMFHCFLIGTSLFTTLLFRVARSPTFLVFPLASAGHLLLDRMWESPDTLFWPLHGLVFGGAEFNLSPVWLRWLQTGGGPLLVDGTGALVLGLFALWLYRRSSLLKWLKTGRG